MKQVPICQLMFTECKGEDRTLVVTTISNIVGKLLHEGIDYNVGYDFVYFRVAVPEESLTMLTLQYGKVRVY